jgi:hypothetical protein
MANRDVNAVTPESAPAGARLLGSYGGAFRTFLASSLANVIEFVASGGGAATRTLLAKLRETPAVTDYIQPGDAGDLSLAITRALAAGTNLRIPPLAGGGEYTMNSPIPFVDGMNIVGANGWTLTSVGPMTRIYCPNGIALNGNTTRKRIYFKNVEFRGPGAASAVDGIVGVFGGRVEECRFAGFRNHIRNASSFLSRYVRNSFYECSQNAISLADANGAKVEDNHFDASVHCHLSMLDETPVTGNNNGYPIVIRGNNSNLSTVTGGNQVAFKLRGIVKFVDNYIEDFSPAVSGNEFVHVLVNRFDNCGLEITGNEMNGQSKATCAIRIYGSHSLDCRANGIISRNRWLGMVTGDVLGGTVADPTLNNITYLRIFDNSTPTDIIGFNPVSRYRPMSTLGWDNNPSIAGATFLQMPISENVLYDNATMSVSNQGRARKAGVYNISGAVTVQTTASNYEVEYELRKGAVVLYSGTHSLRFGANPTNVAITLPKLKVDFAVSENLTLWMRNGQTAPKGVIDMEWVGDGNQ